MLKYTVKRLAQSLVTILLIATIVFLLMRCLPTDYYFTEEQLMKFTEEQKYAALEAAGLTDPIGTQLIHFYNDLLHLDFGTSRRILALHIPIGMLHSRIAPVTVNFIWRQSVDMDAGMTCRPRTFIPVLFWKRH